MSLLEKRRLEEYSILRWAAAYRVACSLDITLSDPKNIKRQAMIFHSV